MEYWQYWKCETDDVGRQVWSFTPPKEFSGYADKDWESEEGRKFLAQMGASFLSLKNQENPNSADKVYRCQKEVKAYSITKPCRPIQGTGRAIMADHFF